MPSYAFFEGPITCQCGDIITDVAWFQWGYCAGYAPHPDSIYRIGDSIRWRKCKDGTIKNWVYFSNGGGNIGEPGVTDLIVLDNVSAQHIETCPSCGIMLGGLFVRILGGVIRDVSVYERGQFPEEAEIYLILPDDSFVAKPEWYDYPMEVIEC